MFEFSFLYNFMDLFFLLAMFLFAFSFLYLRKVISKAKIIKKINSTSYYPLLDFGIALLFVYPIVGLYRYFVDDLLNVNLIFVAAIFFFIAGLMIFIAFIEFYFKLLSRKLNKKAYLLLLYLVLITLWAFVYSTGIIEIKSLIENSLYLFAELFLAISFFIIFLFATEFIGKNAFLFVLSGILLPLDSLLRSYAFSMVVPLVNAGNASAKILFLDLRLTAFFIVLFAGIFMVIGTFKLKKVLELEVKIKT